MQISVNGQMVELPHQIDFDEGLNYYSAEIVYERGGVWTYVYHEGSRLFCVPGGHDIAAYRAMVAAYDVGLDRGVQIGKVEKLSELHQVLGIPSSPAV